MDGMSTIAKSGTGLILVTHHLDDIVPEVTRIVLLENGRVLADGPKEQILTSARLSDLFKTNVEVEERNGYYHLW